MDITTSTPPLPAFLAHVARRDGTTPCVTRASLRRVLVGIRRSLGYRGRPGTRAAIAEATRDLRAGRVTWATVTALGTAEARLVGPYVLERATLCQAAAAVRSHVLAARGLTMSYPPGCYRLD